MITATLSTGSFAGADADAVAAPAPDASALLLKRR